MTARARTAGGLLVAAFALATAGARAQDPPAVPAAPSAKLVALLAATGDGGTPLVPPDARRWFDALPAHARDLVEAAVAADAITSGRHLGVILGLRMDTPTFEVAMTDQCFLCHSDPETHGGDNLLSPDPKAVGAPAHMALAAVVKDVHFRRGLSCAGCHGGDPAAAMGHDFPAAWPENTNERRTDRRWIPGFCGRCHSDAAFMRRFDPALPTDQAEKFRESRHGIVLAAGDSRAAQCVSCHGAHGVQSAKSPLSSVYPSRVPATCATCHADAAVMRGFTTRDGSPMPVSQYDEYRESVHGRALLERGDLGAPACNDCHGNHAAMPPQVASVAQICRNCHARNGTLFDGSRHKQVFEAHGWPECDVCHGKHAIARTHDDMLAPGPASLCERCHREHATGNPECNATAAYFHERIVALASSHDTFEIRAEALADRGLDVAPMHDELNKLFDTLKQARSYVHAFNRSEFAQVADEGTASITRLGTLEAEAEAEVSFRYRGLLAAVALIALLMLLLWLKLRRIERGNDA